MTPKGLIPEQKLAALFAASKPVEQDYGFEIAVLERIGKQRAITRFTHLAMLIVVAGGLLAALLWAMQAGNITSLMPILAAIAASSIAALVVWTLGRARAV